MCPVTNSLSLTGSSGRSLGVSSLMQRAGNQGPLSVKSLVRCFSLLRDVTLAACYKLPHTDDRFIMKQIKAVEISSFEQIAPLYFDHITSALESKVQYTTKCVLAYLFIQAYIQLSFAPVLQQVG